MAAPSSLSALLDSLSQSLTSALEATPKLAGVEPPEDGLSLLDIKNEILLSYLQNLIFLVLLKLRQHKKGGKDQVLADTGLGDAVVKKLVELRLYLERGVRPLEDKLRYQIEKVLRAAEDAERSARAAAESSEKAATSNRELSGAEPAGDDEADDSDNEEDAESKNPKVSDLHYRPNLSAFVRPNASAGTAASSKDKDAATGVYRPPRIAPTAMPTTERREQRAERRPLKSATLDEFIADELSTAPVAEPSIGTTIAERGRKVKTASERAAEAERREYEERNFVRLPKESKKERAKKAASSRGRMNFGGEEWRELGAGVERINVLTKAKSGGSNTKALLERSRKRGIDTVDGPRGSGSSNGVEMGARYQKRLKLLEAGRRDRGKKR
ncbi:hypothetical protein VTK73DRAFT_2534 [Phialemonium thermophilum]|uniref:Uncharacterized protein n=1 Tax=Phialemonium thermophilum TaxID=223376 RepID=A0ABR3X4M1_9PEZI